MKTIGIQKKPELDLEALEKAKKAEEERKKKKAEEEQEEEEENENDEEEEEIEEEEEEEEETPEEKSAREAKEKEAEEAKKKQVDWEIKFKESQKEAMVLKKRLDDIDAEKNKRVEVNDEYLKAKYSDWDDMTTGEQRAIRLAEESKQESLELRNKTNEFNNDRQWADKVDAWIESEVEDNFPKLKGREDAFRKFATRPTRKGLPLDDLAKIFLFENPEPVKQKRTLFSAPGGTGKKPEKKGWTAEEVAKLRTTNMKKYMELIKRGEIKIDL